MVVVFSLHHENELEIVLQILNFSFETLAILKASWRKSKEFQDLRPIPIGELIRIVDVKLFSERKNQLAI